METILTRSGVPLSVRSIGMVISCSTSEADMPGPTVWISTVGGENGGNASTGIFFNCSVPNTTNAKEAASNRKRYLRLEPMSQLNMSTSPCCRVPFGSEFQSRRTQPAAVAPNFRQTQEDHRRPIGGVNQIKTNCFV